MSVEYVEYQASISHESRKIPDVYPYLVVGNKLISPVTGLPVESSMVLNSDIDYQEWIAFQHIQSWAIGNREGVAFWLSPPNIARTSNPNLPPQGKITVSELHLVAGQKQLLNRVILFDTTKQASIAIANQLVNIFSEQELHFDSEEAARSTPIFTARYWSTPDWTKQVEKLIAESYQWDMVATGEDLVEMERTLGIIRSGQQAPMGDNPLSCAPGQSPNAVFGRNAVEGKFVHNCGKCGAEIKKVIYKGYVCMAIGKDGKPCKGVYEGC